MALELLIIILILQLFLMVSVPLFLLRAFVQILSDRTDVPFVRTPQSAFAAIAEALAIAPQDTVYELGSGDGSFCRWGATQYPHTRFVGIERNPLLVRYAKWRAQRAKLTNVEFRKADIFETDFSGVNKIYAYLLNPVMDRLLPKLTAEFHGTLASRAFVFKDKTPIHTIELSKKNGHHGKHLLYLYEF